ncbi:MAG: M56 family metallopeptidase [Phycisphaerales bacterium JB047]
MSVGSGLIEQMATALGIAVLHSLWQCTLIGSVAALLMLRLRGASNRYMVWCVSMLLCAAWMVLTFLGVMWPDAGGGGGVAELGLGRVLPGVLPASPEPSTMLFEIVAWLWAGGFVFFTMRFAQQWLAARRMRTRGVVEAAQCWFDLFDEVRTGLGVSRRVGMLVSTRAESPMVVGWLSPVVIVPLSALTMLSPEQVRLVLVHELAHIRRFDHVVNMLQVLIETVLFYHPVVWWMSHQARLEREHCCDDAAVRWGGDAVVFARALTELETTRTRSRAVLALNPLNHGGSLMNRITRILGTSDHHRLGNGSLRTLAALTAGTLVAAAGIANAAMRASEPREAPIEAVRANVESGIMTEAQARRIFDAVIFPGSDMQLKMDDELRRVQAEIDQAVDSGQITPEAAQEKMSAVREGMDEQLAYHFYMDVLGNTKDEARVRVMLEQLDEQVASGQITKEYADKKLTALIRMQERRALAEAEIHAVTGRDEMTDEAFESYKDEARARLLSRARSDQMGQGEADLNSGAIETADDVEYSRLDLNPNGSTINGTSVRMIDGDGIYGTYEVLEDSPDGVYKAGDTFVVTEPLSGGAVRGIDGVVEPERGADGRLILPGVEEKAVLDARRKQELGAFDLYKQKLATGYFQELHEELDAGHMTKDEVDERIEEALRRERFVARWLSIDLMYQDQVSAGKLSVDEANAMLTEARKANGYFESPYGSKKPMGVVEAGHVLEVSSERVGVPGASGQKDTEPESKKLTPMDDDYWIHQGIRPLDAYDESFADDC